MGEPRPQDGKPEDDIADGTVIFQPEKTQVPENSPPSTTEPVKSAEIDTSTEAYTGNPSAAEGGASSGRTRRSSSTTSGFGASLGSKPELFSPGDEPRPIKDVEELRQTLLGLEMVTASEWETALEKCPHKSNVQSMLFELMAMPASWDAKAPLLTKYQCEEVQEGRGAELRFNQYLVLSLLGEGGMGKVFRARHIYLDAIHALKTIRRELFGHASSANPDAVQTMVKRFLGEFRGMARLLVAKDPDHFAQVHDAGEAEGVPYYAMEFIDGQSLDEMIKERRAQGEPPPVLDTLTLFMEIADAVGTAHELKIVHRDLTPRNIMITTRGRPKIIDFGIAKELKKDEETGETTAISELTTSGQQVGSRPYMSPEQHAGEIERVRFSTDVYVLAATLYHYLTLEFPFPGTNAIEVMRKHLSQERPKPSSARPDIPPRLDEVIQKALAIEPGERYQTMGEFREALEWASVEGGLSSVQPKKPQAGQRRYLFAGAGILAVGLVVATSLFLTQKSGDAAKGSRTDAKATENGTSQASAMAGSAMAPILQEIDEFKREGDFSKVIELCQSQLASPEAEWTDLERKKLLDDLFDATEKAYVPPKNQEDADRIVQIVTPYRNGESTTQYMVDGLLSRAITVTPLSERGLISTLAAGSKAGAAPRSAALERFKKWWSDDTIPFGERIDCLSTLRELSADEATILGRAKISALVQRIRATAASNPQAALSSIGEIRAIGQSLAFPKEEPVTVQVSGWERILGPSTFDGESVESALRYLGELPNSPEELAKLDGFHADLSLASPSPSERAVQAVDLVAKNYLEDAAGDQDEKLRGLNDRAVELGIVDRSTQLSKHFGSQAIKVIMALIEDPQFDLAVLDERLREVGERLNSDQRTAIDAVKSVRQRGYLAAAAKFKESKINTSEPPWGQYRAEVLMEEGWNHFSMEAAALDASRRLVADLETVYGVQADKHPRFAALKAKVQIADSQTIEATATLVSGITALTAPTSQGALWAPDTVRQEIRDVARLAMDQSIAIASRQFANSEDPTPQLDAAESIANYRLVETNPLALDDDGKAAFRNRLTRVSYLRGKQCFRTNRYAESIQRFQKIDAAINDDEFRDAKAYWLVSQVSSEGSVPGKLIGADEAIIVPEPWKGKAEEHLAIALWETGRDLGTTTAARISSSLARSLTEMNLFLTSEKEHHENVPPEAMANIGQLYMDELRELPGKIQGWERTLIISQIVDPKIPDTEKSLRQVEIIAREALRLGDAFAKNLSTEDLDGLKKSLLLLSIKPVGLYASVVKETPIGENTPYKYNNFPNDEFTKEFERLMRWSGECIDAIGPAKYSTDPTVASYLAVWYRARMRLAFFQKDWDLALKTSRMLMDLNVPLREEQPETEVAHLFNSFIQWSKEKKPEEVVERIGELCDPAKRVLPGPEYTKEQLEKQNHWKAMFELSAHLGGMPLDEAERLRAIAQLETHLKTWNGVDSPSVKWPIWERPLVLGYYQQYPAELKEEVATLAKLPMPRVSPTLEKDLADAATLWKVAPKN